MSNGSKEVIKVGFILQQDSGWMGGINYYKNLFMALKTTKNPKIIPYIPQQKAKEASVLSELSESIDFHKRPTVKLYIKLILNKFLKRNYDYSNNYKIKYYVDLFSHSLINKKQKCIYWIPDFQHKHLPEMFSIEEIEERDKVFLNSARNATTVILSSNDAKNDFVHFYPQFESKAKVLHFVSYINPDIYNETEKNKQAIIAKLNLPATYFYCPNQFWKHKNHLTLFKAIAILKKQNIDIKVVFSGNTKDYRNKEYFDSLMNIAKELNITDNIQILGLIDQLEVYYLMRNCISIINPSFFEGWSSTVEEAKSLGKNMIISNLDVHKEQDPPETIYFDPNSPEELAKSMKIKLDKYKAEPNYNLEENAKKNMTTRMEEFGRNYQNIVLETINS